MGNTSGKDKVLFYAIQENNEMLVLEMLKKDSSIANAPLCVELQLLCVAQPTTTSSRSFWCYYNTVPISMDEPSQAVVHL